MDCIDANAPTEYLRNEWVSFILAAEKLLGDNKYFLLQMQNGEPPTSDTERKAFELWNAGLKILSILEERGVTVQSLEEQARAEGQGKKK